MGFQTIDKLLPHLEVAKGDQGGPESRPGSADNSELQIDLAEPVEGARFASPVARVPTHA